MSNKSREKYSDIKDSFVTISKRNEIRLLKGVVMSVICTAFMLSTADLKAQNQNITIPSKDMKLIHFFHIIEQQTNFTFVYNSNKISSITIKPLKQKHFTLQQILIIVLSPLNIGFDFYKDKIIIKSKNRTVPMLKLNLATIQQWQGKIIDAETNEPIAGVSVKLENSTRGSATDKAGVFKLKCSVGNAVVISAIGYTPQRLIVRNLPPKIIKLSREQFALKEVNVIGYGSITTKEQIGAFDAVKATLFSVVPNSVDAMLNGTISGVWQQKNSGTPGGSSTMAIRGVTSLQPNSNSPLLIIDGVPIFNNDESTNSISYYFSNYSYNLFSNYVFNNITSQTQFYKNGWNMVNPEDIKSITVLKDAYSTAIYGSRGAAGVVLIETKLPRKQGLRVGVLCETSIAEPVGKPHVLNGYEYANFYSQYYSQLKAKQVIFPKTTNTNWYNAVIRRAVGNRFNLSIQNRNKQSALYFNFSRLQQESYVIGGNYKNYTTRFNYQQHLNNSIELGANISLMREENTSLLSAKIYYDALIKPPNVPIYNNYGDYTYSVGENPYGDMITNPVAMANNAKGEVISNCGIGNIYAKLKINNWLWYKLNLGVNLMGVNAVALYQNDYDTRKSEEVQTEGELSRWLFTGVLSGKKKVNKHNFKFLLGHSFEQSKQQNNAWYNGSNNNNILNRRYALVSVFGRVNYEYNAKFFAGFTCRIDGSSRFNPESRYQVFPAFSLGAYLLTHKQDRWINSLKIRGSFGYSGMEQSTHAYGALRTYEKNSNGLNYAGKTIIEETNGESLNLAWERTANYDIGADITLLNNSVNITMDYYLKKANNLLIYTNIPSTTGYNNEWVNIGAMENSGVELKCLANILQHSFKWNMQCNIAYNRNIVNKLNNHDKEIWGQDQAYKYFETGKEAAQFYLFDWVGVNPDNGNPLWRYANNTISETPPTKNKDRFAMGSAIPNFIGGIINNCQYKGFELNMLLVFNAGQKMFNGTAAILKTYSTSSTNNLSIDALNYWKNRGDKTTVPALLNQSITANSNYITSRTNSRFLENASFLRLKTISIGYQFPKKIINKLKLKQLKIYAQATNLFTLTNYSGVDPEVSAFGSSSLLAGYDELTMPQAKTYSLGIKVEL